MKDHETKGDRKGRLALTTIRHCECAEPRLDHHRLAWGYVCTEWCCGCGRPSSDGYLDMLAARGRAIYEVCTMAPEARMANYEGALAVDQFVKTALTEGVPKQTIARMLSACISSFGGITTIASTGKASTESAWYRCLLRWVDHVPWSPWLHMDWASQPTALANHMGVGLSFIALDERPKRDEGHTHPEWGSGIEVHEEIETLVFVPFSRDPLRSIEMAADLEHLESQKLREVVLVCSSEVVDRVREELREFYLIASKITVVDADDCTIPAGTRVPYSSEMNNAPNVDMADHPRFNPVHVPPEPEAITDPEGEWAPRIAEWIPWEAKRVTRVILAAQPRDTDLVHAVASAFYKRHQGIASVQIDTSSMRHARPKVSDIRHASEADVVVAVSPSNVVLLKDRVRPVPDILTRDEGGYAAKPEPPRGCARWARDVAEFLGPVVQDILVVATFDHSRALKAALPGRSFTHSTPWWEEGEVYTAKQLLAMMPPVCLDEMQCADAVVLVGKEAAFIVKNRGGDRDVAVPLDKTDRKAVVNTTINSTFRHGEGEADRLLALVKRELDKVKKQLTDEFMSYTGTSDSLGRSLAAEQLLKAYASEHESQDIAASTLKHTRIIAQGDGHKWMGAIDLGKTSGTTVVTILRKDRDSNTWTLVDQRETWLRSVEELEEVILGMASKAGPSTLGADEKAARPDMTCSTSTRGMSTLGAIHKERALVSGIHIDDSDGSIIGTTLDPVYQHAPGSLDKYPVGSAPGEAAAFSRIVCKLGR